MFFMSRGILFLPKRRSAALALARRGTRQSGNWREFLTVIALSTREEYKMFSDKT
jgi:hypothetical protein